jgi:hypothetical protein
MSDQELVDQDQESVSCNGGDDDLCGYCGKKFLKKKKSK